MLTPEQRRQKLGDVVRVASGNFLEMYDFFIFGYFAVHIAHTFFPSEDPFVSLMLSLGTFGAGFFMRPLGAVVLGSYIDRKGRRTGLILTLGLMAVGTISIACTPGYASIGLLAPIVVVIGRLVQGHTSFSRPLTTRGQARAKSTTRRNWHGSLIRDKRNASEKRYPSSSEIPASNRAPAQRHCRHKCTDTT